MGAKVDVVAAAQAALGSRLTAAKVQRLSGGYSWQTFLVADDSKPRAVVRVAPEGGTLDPYDPDAERQALEAAGGSVAAPRVLLVEVDASVYGAPLQVQTVAPGRRVRARSVDSPGARREYRSALAGAVGSLHRRGDASRLGSVSTTGEAVRWVIDREVEHYVRAAPTRHPGFDIGLRWLLSNLPDGDAAPVLCHGDFRLNNVLWTAPGEIGAVLDWERAWAGDPMCDVAFTRQFSGWAAIDGDAVAVYEEASGREVDERRMTFYLRLERWRSYTASMRGLAAVASGRSNRPELALIGEAGVSGMWDLVDWLEDGLVPLPEHLARKPTEYADGLSAERRERLAVAFGIDDPRRLHVLGPEDDEDAARSVAMLRSVTGVSGLSRALDDPDPERAWAGAYELLAAAAADEGRRLHPALQALGLRFTARPTYLPEMRWR
jgi:aminoglycoside phosphotransferase (APT) family kinase protein